MFPAMYRCVFGYNLNVSVQLKRYSPTVFDCSHTA